jgi:hypothetical protein
MQGKVLGRVLLAAIALFTARTASADFFYPISSVTSNTTNDFFALPNLIQGPGVGFTADEPHQAIGGTGPGSSWVTQAVVPNYYNGFPAPVIRLDLGQDRALTEISTWGYSNTNANGVRDFTLRFATAADGPLGYGSSIGFNPGYTMSVDALARQSFAFGQTVNARYVEFTAVNNYLGLGLPGGDRVGMNEIAFESPAPPPPPLPMGTGIIRPKLLSSTNANAFDVALPAKMIDNSGMVSPVNTGDSLASALAATHVFGGHAESWVTNANAPDYYGPNPAAPEFVFDLEVDTYLDAVVLWNYQSDGGGGNRVGNQARTIELQFNTEADGSDAFNGPVTTIFMAPVLTAPNAAQGFGLVDTARYIKMRVVDNHFGDPDGFGVDPLVGGDRVGIAEVRFHGTVVPEPGTTTLVALGVVLLGFVGVRRKLSARVA